MTPTSPISSDQIKFPSILVLGALCIVLAFGLGTPNIAYAKTITVTNTNNDGSGSLRQAITNADSGDTIAFQLTYPATITLTSNEISINKNLTLNGPGASNLTISGNSTLRVLEIASSTTVSITGVTIADGAASDFSGFSPMGGGINNQGTLYIADSIFANNTVYAFGKGSIGMGGAIFNSGTLTISSSTFTSNTCTISSVGTSVGGAIYNMGTLTINGTHFTNSSAVRGGAIDNEKTLIVSDSTFSDNSAADAGAILTGGTASVDSSTFNANTADNVGGAIENESTLTLTNNTFTANHAGYSGGGIYNDFGMVELTHITFSANSAPSGSSIQNYGATTAKNTIFANRVGGESCGGTITDGGGNLRWAPDDLSCLGVYGDPNLSTLADNGGPTWTLALGTSSAALEAGVNANCLATDQRGEVRPNPTGTVCDVGAFESPLRPDSATIENMSSAIAYDGWIGGNSGNANGGTYRESKTKNDTVTFKFSGTQVIWQSKRGPDMGKVQVWLDGINKGTVDLYRATEKWQSKKKFKNLGNTTHTLKLKVLGNKNPQASDSWVAVDAFQVGSKVIQDSALNVYYNTWRVKTDPASSGGNYAATRQANSRVRLTFTGTHVYWITTKGPAYGMADVYLDGVKQNTYDLYASTEQWQAAILFSGLSASEHTLEIRVLGSKNAASTGKRVIVDAFRY